MKVSLSNLSDSELAERLNQEDRNAFAEIYERYAPRLLCHARRMLRDDDQAADIIQDLFVNLFNKRGNLQLYSPLAGFLYQSVKNKILNEIRHEKVKQNYLQTMPDFEPADVSAADDAIREKQFHAQIEQEISLLPPKMQTTFRLSRFEHKSYKEIAAETSVSEGTVKKQINFALKILKARLSLLFLLKMAALLSFFYKI